MGTEGSVPPPQTRPIRAYRLAPAQLTGLGPDFKNPGFVPMASFPRLLFGLPFGTRTGG